GASDGRRLLRDRRGSHRRGGGIEPSDRGAPRAARVDRVPPGGGEGRPAGARRGRGRHTGPRAAAPPLPFGQLVAASGTCPDGRRAVAGRGGPQGGAGKGRGTAPTRGRGPPESGSGGRLREAPRPTRYPDGGGLGEGGGADRDEEAARLRPGHVAAA